MNSDLALLILRRMLCEMGFYQGFAGFVSPITRLDSLSALVFVWTDINLMSAQNRKQRKYKLNH